MESGPEPSYGNVKTGFHVYKSKKPIFLDYGGHLPEYEIAYETWGHLNKEKSNLVLVHTGLSASLHAKSQPENPKMDGGKTLLDRGNILIPTSILLFVQMCLEVVMDQPGRRQLILQITNNMRPDFQY